MGKINTISQAVFEGMTPRNENDCDKMESGKKLGGCPCEEDTDCLMSMIIFLLFVFNVYVCFVLCKFVSGLILWFMDNLWFDDLRAE